MLPLKNWQHNLNIGCSGGKKVSDDLDCPQDLFDVHALEHSQRKDWEMGMWRTKLNTPYEPPVIGSDDVTHSLQRSSSLPRRSNELNACVGTIQTPRGVSSCVLLADGNILTALHVVFDIARYANAYTDRQRQPVQSYFDRMGDIEIYFVKDGVPQRCVLQELVTSGLPMLQGDTRLQALGWDFAILKPRGDVRRALNSGGLAFDTTHYTYGRSILAETPEQISITPPHNIMLSGVELRGVAASSSNVVGMPLEVEGHFIPSSSGNVLVKSYGDNNYCIYALTYTNGGAIYVEHILDNISRINHGRLVVNPKGYHELLRYSQLLPNFVMRRSAQVFDTLSSKNTYEVAVNAATWSLSIPTTEIRRFFNTAAGGGKAFCKVVMQNIQGARGSLDVAFIVRRSDKYLAGIEISIQGNLVLMAGDRLAKYVQVGRIEYPHKDSKEMYWLNSHPFSPIQMEILAYPLQDKQDRETIQQCFDCFILLLEVAKLSVVEHLNEKMVSYEAISGEPVSTLIELLRQGRYLEFVSDDPNQPPCVIPKTLVQIPAILNAIKHNYGSLIKLFAKQTSTDQLLVELQTIFDKEQDLKGFLFDVIFPLLHVLGIIDDGSYDLLLEDQSELDDAQQSAIFKKYEVDIRKLFDPVIK